MDTGPGYILMSIPCITEDMPPLYLGFGLEVAEEVLMRRRRPDLEKGPPPNAMTYRCIRDILKVNGVDNYWYDEQEQLWHEYNFYKYAEIKSFFGKYLKTESTN